MTHRDLTLRVTLLAAALTACGGELLPPIEGSEDGAFWQDDQGLSAAFTPVADGRLEEKAPARNYAQATTLWAGGRIEEVDGRLAESALRWDVSRIPTDAIVSSASLRVFVNHGTTSTYQLFELRKPWTEADMNWTHLAAGVPWELAGAQGTSDIGTTILGAFTGATAGVWLNIPLTGAGIALVQGWVDRSVPNRGLLVRAPLTRPELANDSVGFHSREERNRPTLSIAYTLPAPATSTGQIKVMAFNVAHGEGTDGRTDGARQARYIADNGVDVVCTNESDSGAVQTVLPRTLGERTGRTWNKVPETSNVNLVFTPHVVLSSEVRPLDTYGCTRRNVTRATLSIGGKTVHVFCTHLDTSWGTCTRATSTTRQAEVRELKAFMAEVTGTKIVLGDMNAQHNTTEMRLLADPAQGTYRNAWTEAVGSGTASAYSDNPASLSTRTRKSDLDHVFFQGTGMRVISASVPDQRDLSNTAVTKRLGTADDRGVRPSDHNFKIATIALP